MKVLNALQLKNGAKAEYHRMGTLTQPIQFLPKGDKDESWAAWNVDWYEMQGLKQLRRNARRLLKNYKLANGIIDKTDYIVEEDNEMADLIDVLTKEDSAAFELKFFPIVPNVLNVLCGEFAKRNDKILYRAVDDTSYNEMMQEKQTMIEQSLVAYGENLMQQQIQAMGLDPNSDQAKQMMSPDSIKSLPQIEEYFKKDYRSLYEEWATHQHNVDSERFYMKELENMAFKDMLITDREFWHFKMNEDDYEVEVLNPLLTFYHKSPDARYISQSNYGGTVTLMTVADVIDKYGYKMNEEQLRSIEAIYPVKSAGYIVPGLQNDGSFYDATKSHDWNVNGPSLAMRQMLSFNDTFGIGTGPTSRDIIAEILHESEDLSEYGDSTLLRVTTVYWKSQKMLGHLSYVDPTTGEYNETIIDEDYKVTNKPKYDTSVVKTKSKDNLISGEHIDWIWINEAWGGVKIGPNRPTFYGNADNFGLSPIYLDTKPVKFQFKGDLTLYGCKLPIEGCVFSDRNTKSMSLVDKMKPYQIGYNLVNNQISDILIDELGTVIVLDQNALPRHSTGEDWGNNAYSKAFVAMKNFQMLPLDTSITNTENALNFQHYQALNLEQTQRLLSRVQLSNHFKQQCFESVGLSQQRLGEVIGQQTATGVEQAINMSYAQTEMYFVQHSEYLMPRVHQMRTDLAQFYASTKPSLRLQYMTSLDEKINFELNGTNLLARDFNVFISTKVNQRFITEQIRNLALSNNTAGASIFDLGNIIKADSLSEITSVMKEIEDKTTAARTQEQQASQQEISMEQQAETARQEAKLKFEAEQKALDRATEVEVAKIRAAVNTALEDTNNNKQNDYIDTLEYLDKKSDMDRKHSLATEKLTTDRMLKERELGLKDRELQVRQQISEKQLQVAKTNKNKYDKGTKK